MNDRQQQCLASLERWLESEGKQLLPFQREAIERHLTGEDLLLHVPTGQGKTYAAYLGPLIRMMQSPPKGVALLFITPLRAVTRTLEQALQGPLTNLELDLTLETRTGDTSSGVRARQRTRLPNILITTPESLALLLTQKEARSRFRHLQTIVVDEWHEFLGTKRGTLLELCLARLRVFRPDCFLTGLSASLGNPEQAADVLTGERKQARILTGPSREPPHVEVLVPGDAEHLPWAGHLGRAHLAGVLQLLEGPGCTLLFVNTRSQAERWHDVLIDANPNLASEVLIHHGSLDREHREQVESRLLEGSVRAVIATSSLDLGIDFSCVERVVQVGSPRGVARALQRAGRSAHRPGARSSIHFAPTHALEFVEVAALRAALAQGTIEPRKPIRAPTDVLVQHLSSCALGGGFEPDAMFAEVRGTYAYRELTREAFDEVLILLRQGGKTLGNYPAYRRCSLRDGTFHLEDRRVARTHRMNIGTIESNSSVELKFKNGVRLGSVEEFFLARLEPGDVFRFGGRNLRLVTLNDLTAVVQVSRKSADKTPRWMGGRLPLSHTLAEEVRSLLDRMSRNEQRELPELAAIEPTLARQKSLSVLPSLDDLLVERCTTHEGDHVFLYPFAGRLVHEGLGALLAHRLTRGFKATFRVSVNDAGIELLSNTPLPRGPLITKDLLRGGTGLRQDIEEALDLGGLARYRFREIARIAGLIVRRDTRGTVRDRSLQASASLLFDVFCRHEPDHLLLLQSKREVLEQSFEWSRFQRLLERLCRPETAFREIEVRHPTPFSFPLLIERMAAQVSSESLEARVRKMLHAWST